MAFLSGKAWAAIWSATLQWSRIGLNAAVFIALSRFLTLSEIGAVAAAQAPILIFQSTLASAMPDAVIQEKEPSDSRLASLFWLSVLGGVTASVALFLLSPLLAAQIDDASSLAFFRTLAICPAIWSVACVSEGLLRKSLNVRLLAIRTTIASFLAGIVAIVLAVEGFGGWAMVAFFLVNATTSSVLTLVAQRWLPGFALDLTYLRSISPRLLALAGRYLLTSITSPLLQFVVTAQLGVLWGGAFQLALRLHALIGALVVAPLRFLALPFFTRANEQAGGLRRSLLSAVAVGSCIASPAYLGMIAVAPDALPLLLGQTNGLMSVDLFRLIALYGPFSVPVAMTNEALTAVGLAAVVFRRSLVLYAVVILPCVVATSYSIFLVSIVYSVVGGVSGLLLSLFLARSLLGTGSAEIFFAFARPLLAAAMMFGCVELLRMELANLPVVARLAALILAGSLLYPVFAVLVARPQVATFWSTLRVRKKRV